MSTNEEPISGVQGNTAKGEPYDAGNKDENVNTTNTNTSSSSFDNNPNNTNSADTTTQPAGNAASNSAAENPQAAQPSSTGQSDQTHQQNDVRDPSDPNTHPADAEKRQNVDDKATGAGGLDKDQNPGKVDGPGPRPLEDVARERGGDAGNVGDAGGANKKEGKEGEEAPGDDEEDGPKKKSTGEGTGEKYVKSSGLQADGGDFDATKPGAGREADRLLEQKGLHNPAEDGGKSTPADDAAADKDKHGKHDKHAGAETGEKKSLGDKIKDKLHMH